MSIITLNLLLYNKFHYYINHFIIHSWDVYTLYTYVNVNVKYYTYYLLYMYSNSKHSLKHNIILSAFQNEYRIITV